MGMEPIEHLTASPEETEALGAELALRLRRGDLVALYGQLGSGKTVFARGLARGLGVTEPVTSPTFALMHIYEGRDIELCHVDLYRLSSPDDLTAAGITEFLDDPALIKVVEWAERLGDRPPAATLRVELRAAGEGLRRICLQPSAAGETD